ncbi:MAG: FAD-dependent monooxygenase [Verrucomicrobiales bacterium]|nr:FAD-dependent monooxygenase [Verrucomicrobiales bacterium]
MDLFDVAIVGAGPAGSTCATLCARAGLSVLLLERTLFPRHKVCGDCINPSCWEIFDHLGISDRIPRLDHAELDTVRFESTAGAPVEVPLPTTGVSEIAVRRSDLDALLLELASNSGTTVRQGERLTSLARTGKLWAIDTDHGSHFARHIVAADGRNSTVTRLLRIAPPLTVGRLAVQTHAPVTPEFATTVLLRLLPGGYSGVAPVGNGEMNICLVSAPKNLPTVRSWAEGRFGLSHSDTAWHSVAPLNRKAVAPAPRDGLLVIGDAARVVEPFTGEGIYYALKTGALAAQALAAIAADSNKTTKHLSHFATSCRRAYRHRLWVNNLARTTVTHPALGDFMLAAGRAFPSLLPLLTSKIVAAQPTS